jgi:hypothetical protein
MFSPVNHRSVCVCECMFVGVFVFMCVLVCVFVCVFVCINAGMPDCLASDQSGTGLKKLTMPGIVRYRTKPRQSGILLVRYRTEIIDAGMPMPALVSSMPMPSYVYRTGLRLTKTGMDWTLERSRLKVFNFLNPSVDIKKN